ncbi:signal peptidase I [Pseudonocardia adelaidensis]|uniref:signal peptidase I n=1 Tax=Pseudonocardia adelaidensis TaxID=648754 RepID=UPI003CD09074
MALPELPDDRRAAPPRLSASEPFAPGDPGPVPPRRAQRDPRPPRHGGAPSGNGAGPHGARRPAPPGRVPPPQRAAPPPPPRRPVPEDDEPTVVFDGAVVPSDPAQGEVPGRHRRRAGASPGSKPASEYKEQVEASGRKLRPGRRRRPTFWKELPILIVVALVLTFLIQTFLAKVYVIPSGSMETTLHGCTGCNNDRVLVDKVTYRFRDPAPGDVVVFRGPDSWSSEIEIEEPSSPVVRGLQLFGSLIGLAPPDEKDFVKRVIAVGGQTVQCCDSRGQVMVDGKSLNEPYIFYLPDAGPPKQAPFGPVTVPDGQLWMMGDSRNNSADSRMPDHGAVPIEYVIGQARMIVLPFSRLGWVTAQNPQSTAVGMGDAGAGAPLALGLLGTLPIALLRSRRRRDALSPDFLPH